MKSSLARFHSKQEVAEVIVSALQRSTEMTLWGTGDGNEHSGAKLHRQTHAQYTETLRIIKKLIKNTEKIMTKITENWIKKTLTF